MSDPSPDLLAANERLLALRAQLARPADAQCESCHRQLDQQPGTQPAPDQPAVPPAPLPLPAHLGWHSPAVTAAVRVRQVASATTGSEETACAEHLDRLGTGPAEVATSTGSVQVVSPNEPPPPQAPAGSASKTIIKHQPSPSSFCPLPSSFTLHPSLALALLRRQQVAAGRLWLLLRALDGEGRGWLARADIEAAFADPDSPTHFCTPRYLRRLLAEGDGFFWEREGSEASSEPAERTCLELAERKVWLRSQAKVAAALGVDKLRGRAVELPVSVLLGPIGDLRAHLYASFHSSRGESAPPISRAALRELSGASPRTQQSYDARADVEAQPCLAMGGLATAAGSQEDAWQHGRAAFTFTDHRGQQGAAGSSYQAHQLPNRYIGPHRRLTGRPKRLNRQLIDLCHKGYAGNGQPESEPGTAARRYYADGAAAGRVWLRQQGRILVYWQANNCMANNRLPNNRTPNGHTAGSHIAGNHLANGRQPAVCFWYMLGTGAV